MTHVIEVRGLRKTFARRGGDAFAAVTDVSFTLEADSSLAIVGESGAGKTTVARILVGLERPTQGLVRVCGRERGARRVRAAERRRRARELQMVFQDPYVSLDPRQQVFDAISEVLHLHFRQTAVERRSQVIRVLEQVGLDALTGGAYPRELSGGQRQRVAIARALAVRPRVMILDEAVSALDVSIQAQVLNLLGDIRRDTGMSYLVISHDLAVVRQLADAIIVMRRGAVVETGTVAQVLDSPQHPYTRALRESVPRPGWRPARAAGDGEGRG